MNAKQILGTAGGVVAFVVVVAIGAIVIVSLSPSDKQAPLGTQQALLIETATTEMPFDAPTSLPTPLGPPSGAASTDPDPAKPAAGLKAPAVVKPEQVATREVSPRSPPLVPTKSDSPRVDLKSRAADPAAAAALPKAQARPEGLLTPGEIRRMRLSLRLTREQEPYWPAVEQALLELGMQQETMVRAGQDPKDAFGVGAGMRIYSAARPLLDVLREDQKQQVRARARALGFGAIASSI